MNAIIEPNAKSIKECTHNINDFKISSKLSGLTAVRNYIKVEPKKSYLQRDDDICKMNELITQLTLINK
jgi:hypothetical protein